MTWVKTRTLQIRWARTDQQLHGKRLGHNSLWHICRRHEVRGHRWPSLLHCGLWTLVRGNNFDTVLGNTSTFLLRVPQPACSSESWLTLTQPGGCPALPCSPDNTGALASWVLLAAAWKLSTSKTQILRGCWADPSLSSWWAVDSPSGLAGRCFTSCRLQIAESGLLQLQLCLGKYTACTSQQANEFKQCRGKMSRRR